MNRVAGERALTDDGGSVSSNSSRTLLFPRTLRFPVRVVSPLFRGVAQVDFMPSALCGVFFVAALLAGGWQYALGALLGAAVSTLTAAMWGVDHDRVVAGLEGFNGCLVGVGVPVFLGPTYLSTWVVLIGGAIGATVVTSAFVTLLGTWKIATLTFPFCVVASVLTIGGPEFERVWHGRPAIAKIGTPADGPTMLAWADIWRSFFANVGQIFLMPQWYVGLLFLIGIFAVSRRAGLVAALGSGVGTLSAWALGSPAEEVRQGLLGYNAVLVSMALCGVFVAVSGWSVAYAVIGAAASTGVTGAVTYVFEPFGGHTLTWPFVLTALVFLLAVPSLPRLRRI